MSESDASLWESPRCSTAGTEAETETTSVSAVSLDAAGGAEQEADAGTKPWHVVSGAESV